MIKKIWRFLSSVKVTIWIILTAIVLLLIGSIYVPSNRMGFNSLNHMPMQEWLQEWAFQNLDKTWWFLALVAVLLVLGINTGCCVLDRLLFYWHKRGVTGTRVFILRITPSLIHACFGIMLLGHFASTCIGYRSRPAEFVSRQGESGRYTLPGDIQMVVGEPECTFYSEPFPGAIRRCRIGLSFDNGERTVEKEVALGQPLFWDGFQVHMSQMSGQSNQGSFSTPAFQLLVKRDAGLPIILFCFPVLIFLVLYFYIEERRIRRL